MSKSPTHGGRRDGAGRPKSPDPRSEALLLRLRPDDDREIREAAEILALPISTWARSVLVREARAVIAANSTGRNTT